MNAGLFIFIVLAAIIWGIVIYLKSPLGKRKGL